MPSSDTRGRCYKCDRIGRMWTTSKGTMCRLCYELDAIVPEQSGDWLADAACAGAPSHLFYDEVFIKARAYADYCNACPVLQQCGEQALRARDFHGVWGGMTPEQRRSLDKNKGRVRIARADALAAASAAKYHDLVAERFGDVGDDAKTCIATTNREGKA